MFWGYLKSQDDPFTSIFRFVTMEQVERQLDIETLLAGSSGLGRQNEVFDVLSGRDSWLSPLQSEQPWKDFSHLAKPESDRSVYYIYVFSKIHRVEKYHIIFSNS